MSSTVLTSREAAAAAGRAEIAAAEQEHRQAVDLLAALRERVRAGDDGVQPAELADAQALVDHAVLRVDAAKRRAEQAVTEARHRLYVDIGEQARSLTLDDQTVTEAFTAAVTALHRLYAAAGTRSQRLRDVAGQATAVKAEADQHGERGRLRAAGVHNAELDGLTVVHDDGTATRAANVAAHEVALAVTGRLFADLKQEADPNTYMPWSGGDTERVEQALTAVVRSLPQIGQD